MKATNLSTLDREHHPANQSRVDLFLVSFKDKRPAFAKEILRARQTYPDLFDELALPMLAWAEAKLGPNYIDTLIDGYSTFVMGVNRSMARYEKEGQYQFSSFKEVYEHTYGSDDIMSAYHWGVYLITFGWSHLLPLYRLYRDGFLSRLGQLRDPGLLLDLGCGSGIWHIIAINSLPDLQVQAVDISPKSVELSRDTAAKLGLADRVEYTCMDALDFNLDRPAQAGVSSFLLEHLEDPARLLQSLARNIEPKGVAYVSCALTAAEVDHIYEFRYESQPIKMAEEAGFRLLECHASAPASVPQGRRFLPRSMGMVLERKQTELW